MANMITLTGGGFQNSFGQAVANGTLTLTLSTEAAVIASPNGQVVSAVPLNISLDSNGNVSGTVKIWSNAELTPSGTYYTANLVDGNGAPVWSQPQIWVFSQSGGSSVNLSTMTPGNASSPSYPGAVLLSPAADQTITAHNLLPASGNTTQSLGSSSAPWNGFFLAESVQNLEGMLFADQFSAGTVALQIQAANNALSGTGLVFIPASMGTGSPASPSSTSTFIDLRAKTYNSNPVQSAVNITDGWASSDWVSVNTGGLPRAKLYVGCSPQSGAFPGDLAAMFVTNAFGGTLGSGVSSNAQWAAASILLTTQGTDSLTNSTFLAAHEFNISLIGTGLSLYDVRGMTSSVFGGTPSGQGTLGIAKAIDAQGFGGLPATGLHVAKAISLHAETPNLNVANQNTLSGTVNTSGTTVTWVSGDKFIQNAMPTLPIVINGTTYQIASVSSPTSMTLASSAGTQTGVAYSYVGQQYALLAEGNIRLDPQNGVSDPQGGGGIIVDSYSGGTASQAFWFRDRSGLTASKTYPSIGLRCNGSSPTNPALEIIQQGTTTAAFGVNNNGIVSTYNAAATAGVGVPPIVFADKSATLTANYNSGSAKTVVASPTAGSVYRISGTQQVVRAATTSCTFPSLTLGYTDAGGIARTLVLVASNSTNATTNLAAFSTVIYVNATGVTLTSASYASSGATSMEYALSYAVEQLS